MRPFSVSSWLSPVNYNILYLIVREKIKLAALKLLSLNSAKFLFFSQTAPAGSINY